MKKTVLITGVAGGVGEATAKVFRKRGWLVFGVDRVANHPSVLCDHYIQADISASADQKEIFVQVRQKAQRLDALVNNAAIQICKPLMQTTIAEWDRVMANNLRAVFLSVQQAFPLLNACQGAIVNVSSVHAVATSPSIAA